MVIYMDSQQILNDVALALREDVGAGDVTAALLPEDLSVKAKIISREPMLVCGRPWVDAVFAQVSSNTSINWLVNDGDFLDKPQVLCEIYGPVQSILTAERTALNFLQTLSGTATTTYFYLQKILGKKTKILDTRKTIPGLRYAQKYAVACAGAINHRIGLFDAFLIKENHIKVCGSIEKIVRLAKNYKPNLPLILEVESLEELNLALSLPVDRIILDNFDIAMLKQAVELRGNKSVGLEYSGNVNLDNIVSIADTRVDFISIGSITKSIVAIDLSLLIMDF